MIIARPSRAAASVDVIADIPNDVRPRWGKMAVAHCSHVKKNIYICK